MATPIAHKGALQGAKVQALTLLDILLTPKVVADAWDYFNTVQTKDIKYKSFLAPNDKPAIWLNDDIMARIGRRCVSTTTIRRSIPRTSSSWGSSIPP